MTRSQITCRARWSIAKAAHHFQASQTCFNPCTYEKQMSIEVWQRHLCRDRMVTGLEKRKQKWKMLEHPHHSGGRDHGFIAHNQSCPLGSLISASCTCVAAPSIVLIALMRHLTLFGAWQQLQIPTWDYTYTRREMIIVSAWESSSAKPKNQHHFLVVMI